MAERDLEIEMMKEIAATNGRRAGPSRAGGVCETPRVVATPVCTLLGGALLARAEAKAIIEAWRRHYNEVRPRRASAIRRRQSSPQS